MAFAGTTAPPGWYLCDGSTKSRTGDAALFSVIGISYGGGDGVTTFNLPNLSGRLPMGAGTGAGLTPRTVGQAFGEENHTVTTAELPSHAHTLLIRGAGSGPNVGCWNMDWSTQGIFGSTCAVPATEGAGYQNFMTVENTGGGAAGNNVPPALVLSYIIKN